MARLTWWHRWGMYAAAGALSGGVVWFAFIARRPVPVLDWFDLGVHEAGHLLAGLLPEVVMFMAGSFVQIALPLALAWYFGVRRRDAAGGGFCLVWAGASAWDVSVYAADAVAQQLPLIGVGEHDWAFILGRFDALHLTDRVSSGIELGGGVLAAFGVAVILYGAFVASSVRAVAAQSPQPELEAMKGDPWLSVAQLPFKHEERKSA